MSDYVRNWELRQAQWNDPSSGIQFELKVVQTPKQGRANPPAPLEGKESCNQPNKKQKKNGKNDVAGDRAAATNGVEQKGISANQGKKIVSLPKFRPRVPLDPPAVIELLIHDNDPKYYYRNCPHIMCAASLFAVHSDGTITQSKLSGMTVSSMHSIKSKPDGSSHAYFVFQDLSPVYAGQYYLLFTVFTIGAEGMKSMQSVPSDTFVVTEYKAAAPTLPPATPLTKSLADSGVKLRLRKEAAKRKTGTPDWSAGKPAICSAGAVGTMPFNGVVSGGPLPVSSASLLHGANFRIPTAGESIEDRVIYEPHPNPNIQHLPIPYTNPPLQPLYVPAPGPSSYTGPSHTGFSMLNPYAPSESTQNELSGYSQHHHAAAGYHNMLGASNGGYTGSIQDDVLGNTDPGRRSQDNMIAAHNSSYASKNQDHMLAPASNTYTARSIGLAAGDNFPAVSQEGTTSMSSSGMYETTLGSGLPTLENHGYMSPNHNNLNMPFNHSFPSNHVQSHMGTYDGLYHPFNQGSMNMINNSSFAASADRSGGVTDWAHSHADNDRRGMM